MHWLRLVLFGIVPLLLALAAPMLVLWAWGNGLPLLPALLVGLLFVSAALVVFVLGALSQGMAAEQHDALWTELEGLRQQVRQLAARLQGARDHSRGDASLRHREEQPSLDDLARPDDDRHAANATPAAGHVHDAAADFPRTATPHGQLQPPQAASPASEVSLQQAVHDAAAVAHEGDGGHAAPSEHRQGPAGPVATGEGRDGASAMPAAPGGAAAPCAPAAPVPGDAGGAPQQAPHVSPAVAAPQVPHGLQGFQLYMEPVVELASGRTWLYRALPALPAADGRFYLGRHAQLRARALGQAGALQRLVLGECLRFATALHARGGGTPVICPVDVAALAHDDTVRRLHGILSGSSGEARQGVLLAMPVEELARASRTARQHVQDLAAHVAACVLEHGGLPDPETPLPLPLTVRYVEAPATTLGLAGQLSDTARHLQGLQARGMALIASGIDDEQLLGQVRALAALGRGRMFGAPRRVRLPGIAGDNPGAPQEAPVAGHGSPPLAAVR